MRIGRIPPLEEAEGFLGPCHRHVVDAAFLLLLLLALPPCPSSPGDKDMGELHPLGGMDRAQEDSGADRLVPSLFRERLIDVFRDAACGELGIVALLPPLLEDPPQKIPPESGRRFPFESP